MCAVIRRGSSVGAIPTRQLVVPAGSHRSGGGGNEVAEAFDAKGQRVAPRAGRPQRAGNAEQAPKAVMGEPTRPTSGEGRRRWTPEGVRHPPHERHGPAVPPGYWRQHVRRGDPTQHGKSQSERGSGPQPDAREGQAGPAGMADGFVVPSRPGNAGGGKGPEFREGVRRGMRARRVANSRSPPITVQAPQATSRVRPRVQRGGACVPVREPGAGDPHARFDGRGVETEQGGDNEAPATERVGNS
jgi:hypothetical protein